MAPRVRGKILETETGKRIILIEQKGIDLWRGRHRSLNDALAAGEAGIGVDRILLQRAVNHGVEMVLIVVEETRRIYMTVIEDFSDEQLARTRANYQGRATRIVPMQRFHQKFLGPVLHTRKSRARSNAC